MTTSIAIPLWLLLFLMLCAGYAVVVSVLFPGFRWFVRRRLNKAVDKLNSSLQIQIKPLQRTKRQVLIEQLMFDQQVLATIDAMAVESNTPKEVLQQRVRNYAKEIVPSFNAYVYYRIGYWLSRWLSRYLYRVKVAAADRKQLQAIDPEATIVFVMNHRSNMDYVLICYLAAEQVTLSYAVGEWARVFPLESLIRAMGAFFVRRGSQNPLYRKVLERYVYMATQSGVCQAVFLEGGLSRDGSLGEPRLGFLDYMLRNFNHNKDRDIVFIPVGINYDRVLEDYNLMHWDNKDARPGTWDYCKRVFQFGRENVAKGSRSRWRRFGYASVNFGIPISAREYCVQHQVSFDQFDKHQRIQQVSSLAGELMRAIAHVVPVLPIPLIATVFARSTQPALKTVDILLQCEQLADEMIANGAAMRGDQKPRYMTLQNSLNLLVQRGILMEAEQSFCVTAGSESLIKYYANSIGHYLK